MAYIAVNSAGDFVRLDINASGSFANANVAMAQTANVMTVPALQDVTVNATPGLFRWKQLDALSEYVVTTPSTNSVALTIVLDDTTFFTGANSTPGLFTITNNKTLTYFRLYWKGSDSGDRYVEGEGYLTALAPTVTPDAPVWTTPLTIEVVGNFVTGVK
jgi:hypothetical protein